MKAPTIPATAGLQERLHPEPSAREASAYATPRSAPTTVPKRARRAEEEDRFVTFY
jgi:hypothetical protein